MLNNKPISESFFQLKRKKNNNISIGNANDTHTSTLTPNRSCGIFFFSFVSFATRCCLLLHLMAPWFKSTAGHTTNIHLIKKNFDNSPGEQMQYVFCFSVSRASCSDFLPFAKKNKSTTTKWIYTRIDSNLNVTIQINMQNEFWILHFFPWEKWIYEWFKKKTTEEKNKVESEKNVCNDKILSV